MQRPSLMNSDIDMSKAKGALNTVLGLAAAFAAGALVMYLMDPVAGRRRRALMRDRSVAMGHDAQHFVHAKSKRAADRMKGAVAKTRARLSPEPVDDERLHERIRSKMGRIVAHPHQIHVDVHYGRVVLKGNATRDEADDLISFISRMHGVEAVHDLLTTEQERPLPQQQADDSSREMRH